MRRMTYCNRRRVLRAFLTDLRFWEGLVASRRTSLIYFFGRPGVGFRNLARYVGARRFGREWAEFFLEKRLARLVIYRSKRFLVFDVREAAKALSELEGGEVRPLTTSLFRRLVGEGLVRDFMGFVRARYAPQPDYVRRYGYFRLAFHIEGVRHMFVLREGRGFSYIHPKRPAVVRVVPNNITSAGYLEVVYGVTLPGLERVLDEARIDVDALTMKTLRSLDLSSPSWRGFECMG